MTYLAGLFGALFFMDFPATFCVIGSAVHAKWGDYRRGLSIAIWSLLANAICLFFWSHFFETLSPLVVLIHFSLFVASVACVACNVKGLAEL